ncbi:hypothetical protein [Hydrogenivirga sp.]
MKVLIVSFDKTLTEDLKKALADHEVYVAKNSEEAIKMIPSDIEGVIYDAISGAISEEDINTLYTKKFSNARYVILYDELFPVDENNITVPQKLLIPRDESPKEIVNKLVEFPETAVAPSEAVEEMPEVEEQPVEEVVQEIGEEIPELEIEPTAYETPTQEESPEEVVEELAGSVEEALQEIEAGDVEQVAEVEPEQELAPITGEEVPEMETPEEAPSVEEGVKEAQPAPAQVFGTGKILIVSFDQTLIDSIKAAFGQKHEVVSVKTVKQAVEQGADASIVVFDAISGVIAEKGLIELSNDPTMSQKSYIILVDDLFPINVDGIPLKNKVSVSRDTDPSRIKEMIEEKLSETAVAPAQQAEAPQLEEAPVEEAQEEIEIPPVEELEAAIEAAKAEGEQAPVTETGGEVEEQPIEEVVQEIGEEIPELEIEPTEAPTVEAPPEEESIPALEALEKVMEEQEFEVEEPSPVEELVEGVSQETPREVEEEAPPPSVSVSSADLDRLVESAIAKALSEDRIREAVSKALEDRMLDIRDMVADVVRREVEKVFEELDIRNLIRQATYQALRERLEELIT